MDDLQNDIINRNKQKRDLEKSIKQMMGICIFHLNLTILNFNILNFLIL